MRPRLHLVQGAPFVCVVCSDDQLSTSVVLGYATGDAYFCLDCATELTAKLHIVVMEAARIARVEAASDDADALRRWREWASSDVGGGEGVGDIILRGNIGSQFAELEKRATSAELELAKADGRRRRLSAELSTIRDALDNACEVVEP